MIHRHPKSECANYSDVGSSPWLGNLTPRPQTEFRPYYISSVLVTFRPLTDTRRAALRAKRKTAPTGGPGSTVQRFGDVAGIGPLPLASFIGETAAAALPASDEGAGMASHQTSSTTSQTAIHRVPRFASRLHSPVAPSADGPAVERRVGTAHAPLRSTPTAADTLEGLAQSLVSHAPKVRWVAPRPRWSKFVVCPCAAGRLDVAPRTDHARRADLLCLLSTAQCGSGSQVLHPTARQRPPHSAAIGPLAVLAHAEC